MEKRKWLLIVVAAVIVIIIIVVVVWVSQKSASNPNGVAAPTGTNGQPQSATRALTPANVVVPDEGAQTAPTGVAVPKLQTAASQTSGAQFRSFAVAISNNAYNPATIAVNKGDIVDLELTAVDGNYGFTQPDYGYDLPISMGKTQKVQFQALNSGKFTFYCSACGGPAKGPVGYLIVK
jgi:plastocyanin